MLRVIAQPHYGLTPAENDFIIWRTGQEFDIVKYNEALPHCTNLEHCGSPYHCTDLAKCVDNEVEYASAQRQRICPECPIDFASCQTVPILMPVITGRMDIIVRAYSDAIIVDYADPMGNILHTSSISMITWNLLPFDGLPDTATTPNDEFVKQRNLLYNQFLAAENGLDPLDTEDRAIADRAREEARARYIKAQQGG